jgi:hypothetical protein
MADVERNAENEWSAHTDFDAEKQQRRETEAAVEGSNDDDGSGPNPEEKASE